MFRKKLNSSALELLEKHEQMLCHECLLHSQQLGAVSQTFEGNWKKKIVDEASFIISVTKGREALRNVIFEIKKNKKNALENKVGSRYQISSLFLKDCLKYLKSDPGHNERIHLVTGTITAEGTKVLSRMEKVRYDRQSAVYVRAEKIDSHQKIVSLAEDYGHLVLAVFHSHTSEGISATAPSSIDRSFLQRMAKIGCDCLGGIFSLDGYVRFFMANEKFEIEVYGKGIKKITENSFYKIFKIVEKINHERESI